MGRVSAEFLVPDLSGYKCTGGPERTKSREAHTCFGRWLMATDFVLLPRGNRMEMIVFLRMSRADAPICTAWPEV